MYSQTVHCNPSADSRNHDRHATATFSRHCSIIPHDHVYVNRKYVVQVARPLTCSPLRVADTRLQPAAYLSPTSQPRSHLQKQSLSLRSTLLHISTSLVQIACSNMYQRPDSTQASSASRIGCRFSNLENRHREAASRKRKISPGLNTSVKLQLCVGVAGGRADSVSWESVRLYTPETS
jgi:hypothetical protein